MGPLPEQHRSTRPESTLLGSAKAASAAGKLRRKPAMQKPFSELINELGETGRGQNQQTCPQPHYKSQRHGMFLNARLRPYRLRPRALPSGCPQLRAAGTSAGGAERAARRQGHRHGPGPPVSPAAERRRPARRTYLPLPSRQPGARRRKRREKQLLPAPAAPPASPH